MASTSLPLAETVRSKDGSQIAFERSGTGPPLILVDGALCYRASGPMRPLAGLLAPHFTVFTYDRRGRGDSEDRQPYAVEREVEDLQALIDVAGGRAAVYGISSGAALALESARRGLGVTKLALFEAPFIVDNTREAIGQNHLDEVERLLSEGRRGDAVKFFLKLTGVPTLFLSMMRLAPMWGRLTSVAHTLPYDFIIVGPHQTGLPLPAGEWTGVTIPTLVMAGTKSPPWMHHAMQALAAALPSARFQTLPGENHMVRPHALVAPLVEFVG